MSSFPLLETSRLMLRPITPDDRDAMFRMDSNPRVHQYLGNQPLTDPAQLDAVFNALRFQYDTYGIGRYAAVEKSSGEMIGWVGLKWITEKQDGRVEYYDLGYRLSEEFWGKGYASEAAQAWIRYAFDVLKTDQIWGMLEHENIASANVMKKSGLLYEKNFVDEEGILIDWYTITRNRFEEVFP